MSSNCLGAAAEGSDVKRGLPQTGPCATECGTILPMPGSLFYGDNLDLLRRMQPDTVDLVYIDPPFNSKRTYNQIYTNVGTEDRAQAQAFVDTWTWEQRAIDGYAEILANDAGRFSGQTVELIKGLHGVLGEGSLLAYLISMTLRIVELRRVLKPTGSLYLHCDPTASHYLKLVIDGVFCSQGGEFLNEIIWCYNVGGKGKNQWAKKHDVLLFYSKGSTWFFDGASVGVKRETGTKSFGGKIGVDEQGRRYQDKLAASGKYYRYYLDAPKIPEDWWVGINSIQSQSAERLGYPTQKPEELLERVIKASSREGDLVLDAYCGCGTSVAVAERLKRKWIGMDITYQAIALILKRMEDRFGKDVLQGITVDGVPRDMASAAALAHKQDDRVRKEFEKWAVLTYTNNRGIINEKKGADEGVDGTVYFLKGPKENGKMVLQVKSGGVGRKDIAMLRGDMDHEEADLAVFITLEEPTKPMRQVAKAAGQYEHALMGRKYDRIQIVTVREMLEQGRRLDLPLSHEVLRSAERFEEERQIEMPGVAKTEAPEAPADIERKPIAKAPAVPPEEEKKRGGRQ